MKTPRPGRAQQFRRAASASSRPTCRSSWSTRPRPIRSSEKYKYKETNNYIYIYIYIHMYI